MTLAIPTWRLVPAAAILALAACATGPTDPAAPAPAPASPAARPAAWSAPEVLVAPSSFTGVHGLAVDARGRLLAGSVFGNNLWEIDRATGQARVLIGPPAGQAESIAAGPRGELAWTSYLQGIVRHRSSDEAPTRDVAVGLAGAHSLAFDRRGSRLYVSQLFQADALWEIDVASAKPPRLVARDLGGFRGFEAGPDGLLYGALWSKGQVARVDPATGAVTGIAGGFTLPAAARLDGKGNLWVVDAGNGELSRVELAGGRKTVVQRLRPTLEHLAIAPDGTIYLSNTADNAVQAYAPATGQLRTLLSGRLAAPGGLRLEGDALWVADLFSLRRVDVRSGEVHEALRMQASDLQYPVALGLGRGQLALASWLTGSVLVIDRATMQTRALLTGLKLPTDALFLADGSLVYAEMGTGTLTRARGNRYQDRQVIAKGLAGPVQMILGSDGLIYLTEAGGNLTRINPEDGSSTVVAGLLALPEGLAQTPWGTLIVAEAGPRRLVEIDPANGLRRLVADQLPIGLEASPGLPPSNLPTGVAVGADGTIYLSADRNNAIYRIRPQR